MCGAIDQGVLGTLMGCCCFYCVKPWRCFVKQSTGRTSGVYLLRFQYWILRALVALHALEVRGIAHDAPLPAVEVRD